MPEIEKDLCSKKNICGSCAWSEIPYQDQLNRKLASINEALATVSPELKCTKIISSPKTSHYRNRMDFVIDYQGRVGLREKGKWWSVIDDHTCFISDEKIEALFHKVRDWAHASGFSYFDRRKYTGFLRYAVIRSTSTGETMVNVITSSPESDIPAGDILKQFDLLSKQAFPTTLLWSVNNTKSDVSFGEDVRVIRGEGFIEETINGYKYRISPDAFFQTNSSAAPLLQNTVLDYARDALKNLSPVSVLDLYCGTGFFSIPLSALGNVTGVELSVSAINDAKVNASLNNLSSQTIQFFAEKAEDLSWADVPADLLVVDPPRAGLHPKVVETILSKQFKHIVYVSCNYESFARDLKVLRERYNLVDSTAVDMFPHTPHVELVSLLKISD